VAGDLVDLEVADRTKVPEAAQKLSTLTGGGGHVQVEDRHVRGRVQRAGRTIQGLLRDLDRAGIDLDSIEVHRPTLDDVFLSLTGRSLRDAEAADKADQHPADPGDPTDTPDRTENSDAPQGVLR
jgi:ABC-2 type transport system ATP-binding protein